jgi:hypothetical protein
MSNLSDRTTSRKMNRPNANKALDRIQAELIAVINASPARPVYMAFAISAVTHATNACRLLFREDRQ